MALMQDNDAILDFVKMTSATAPAGLTVLGYPIDDWAYVVSITVGLFFVIEKLPAVLDSLKELKRRFTK